MGLEFEVIQRAGRLEALAEVILKDAEFLRFVDPKAEASVDTQTMIVLRVAHSLLGNARELNRQIQAAAKEGA